MTAVAPPPPITARPITPIAPVAAGTSAILRKGSETTTLPPRVILNAVEGWGKTTLAAQAPNPVILQSRGETGYQTLYEAGLVPDIPGHEFESWPELLATIPECGTFGTIILDALSGFERLCHELVCQRDFSGDWSDKGFSSFMRGYDVSVTEWLKLLAALDKCRGTGAAVIILSHVQVRPFKNPMGSDFDRYIADCHAKTWGITHKWADAVLFGTFLQRATTDKQGKTKPGTVASDRVLYSERTDAYDAKNRYGMKPQLLMPADRNQMFAALAAEIKPLTKGAK
jgi:hypothetical protein